MRSIEGDAVGFNTFWCDECQENHPVYITTTHPHKSEQWLRDYNRSRSVAPRRKRQAEDSPRSEPLADNSQID